MYGADWRSSGIPKSEPIARDYIVDNGGEVFRAMSWQFAFDPKAVSRAEKNFAELRKVVGTR